MEISTIFRMILGAVIGLTILLTLGVSKENYIFIIPILIALSSIPKKKGERIP